MTKLKGITLAPEGQSGVEINQTPLNNNLSSAPIKTPKFNLAPEGESGVEVLGFTPVSMTADLSKFDAEESRQRELYREVGVDIRPGIDLEGTAGRLQGTGIKWNNGLVKMVGTAVTTFLEPFVDMTYGVAAGAITGEFSRVYDNAITQSFDEFNEYMRKEYPNYYTKAERDMGFAQSLGTSNFWSDQGLQGMGFLAGAIASGYVAGASNVVGATYRSIGMGKVRAWRNVVNNFRKTKLGSSAAQVNKTRDIIGSINTNALNANTYGAGLFSALGEAGIEARESKRRATEIMQQLRATGDPRYEDMTDEEIDNLSDTGANIAYGLNALIVGGSNVLQFGKAFSRGWNPTSKKYLTGLISKDTAKKGALKFNFKELPKQWQKATQSVAWLKRPSVEAFEEWSQASINVAVEDYFKDVYSANPWNTTADYIEGGMGIMSTLADGYIKSPQTKEGQQAIFLGALLGKLGEAGSALKEDGSTSRKDWIKTYERTKDLTAKLNNLDPNGTLQKLLQAHAQIQKSQDRMDTALKDNDVFSYKNEEAGALYSLIEAYIEAERIDDFKSFVDSIAELSNEEFKEAMGIPKDIEVKDVAEQVKDIKNKIEFIEDQKPKIDKFIMSAVNLDEKQKFAYGVLLKRYGYMADNLDSRREKLAREISKLTNGNVNYETLKGLKVDSVELKTALAEMMENANNDVNVDPISLNSLPDAFEDIGKVEALRQAYIGEINKIIDGELEPTVINKIKKVLSSEEKVKTNSETEAEQVKKQVLAEEDEALIEDKENAIAQETPTLTEEVTEAMTITEEDKEDVQKSLKQSRDTLFDRMLKSIGLPAKQEMVSLLEEQRRALEGLADPKVDVKTTTETPIKLLLSYPNASVRSIFQGEEGILFKDPQTGETVFESQSGKTYVLGQNTDNMMLQDLNVQALEDQTFISLVTDGRTFEIGGKYYNNLFINELSAIDPFLFRQDEPGFVPRRVTLFDSEGNKVVFVNPFIVQEVSRLISMMAVIRKQAEIELFDFTKGDQIFEFEGKKYYIEQTIGQPMEVDGRYTTASERNAGIPVSIVYNENLNKLRSPSKIAQVIKARDAHVDNYIREKIDKFKEEYNEEIFGKRTDVDAASRTEEEVKQDAAESTGEPASAESIGTDQTAPNKTNEQATTKPKPEEIERGAEISSNEESTPEESPFYENTTNESSSDVAPIVTATETTVDDNSAETRQSIVNASDLDMEVPDNDNVDISNEDANRKNSDIIDVIQPLETILSLAWKSLNHPFQAGEDNAFNKRLTNLLEGDDTTEFGKLKENGTLKGADIIFKIDLKDPNLTKVESMQAIASKVKNKKPLSPQELGKLPIKALIQVPNANSSTGVSQFQTYVHISDYINEHIALDEQEGAKQLLSELRSTVYSNYLNGIESKSFVTEMTGGHLNNVNRNDRNNLLTFLNVGRKGNPITPTFVFARNGNYVNEFGEVDKDFKFLSVKPKLDENGKVVSNNDGAVYIKIPMNNGEMFPLRVFTSELNKELSTLIWQLVNGMLRQKLPNFNSEISEFSRLKDPKNSEIYRDLAGVLDSVLESENPTYNQVLDLLIYKGKKTVNSKAPTFHYSSGKMKLGDKVYNAAEWNDSKEEVIEYLMANKRTHVNAKYMNSKTQNAYNTFLAKHNLVFTNAFTNSSTRSPFVQPTLRFAPIGAKKEERAPLAAPSPMVKPEAPVGKKESTSSNQVRNIIKYGLAVNDTAYEVEAIGPKGNRFLIQYDGEKGRFKIYSKYQPEKRTYVRSGESKFYNIEKSKEIALTYLGKELVDKLEEFTIVGNKISSKDLLLKGNEVFKERLQIVEELRQIEPKPSQEAPVTKKESVKPNQVTKIISGGQTGADRIGLEVGKELGIETGGVAPMGYKTEKGSDLSLKEFGLTESTDSGYKTRTIQNLTNSNGTVLFGDMNSAGSKLTITNLKRLNKPYIVNPTAKNLQKFLTDNNIKVLNVAGNRGSKISSENAAKYAQILKDALGVATREKESPKPNKPISPSPAGLGTLTMSDLPADIQAEAAAALAAFEAGDVTDLNKDKELVEAGLGAIVPTASKVANILKSAKVVTGQELQDLLEETSRQGKLELNLEQEDGTAPSDNTVDWGEDTNWMLDITKGMDLDDNLDITKQNLDCE